MLMALWNQAEAWPKSLTNQHKQAVDSMTSICLSKIQAMEHKVLVVRTFSLFTIAIPREIENYNNDKTSAMSSNY